MFETQIDPCIDYTKKLLLRRSYKSDTIKRAEKLFWGDRNDLNRS